MTLDQPGRVVGFAERQQRLTKLLDSLEGPHPQQVFLERADEPLGTAIAFRCPDEGGRTLDAEEGDLGLEVVIPIRLDSFDRPPVEVGVGLDDGRVVCEG